MNAHNCTSRYITTPVCLFSCSNINNIYDRCSLFVLGYTYIKDLLLSHSEKDFVEARAILSITLPYIINKLDVKSCIDKLFESNVITESDKEEIECRERINGPIAATKLLIDKVPRKSPHWDAKLAEVFNEHGLTYVADMIYTHCNDDHVQCSESGNLK